MYLLTKEMFFFKLVFYLTVFFNGLRVIFIVWWLQIFKKDTPYWNFSLGNIKRQKNRKNWTNMTFSE